MRFPCAGAHFRGFTGSQLLRPVRLLAPWTDQTGILPPATGGFYVQASDGSVALPAAGYDYDIDWTPMSAGLAPAGMAASFAALARMSEAGPTLPRREAARKGGGPRSEMRDSAPHVAARW